MRRHHAARGQSLVEFALVLPAFLAVALLCLQLGVLGVRWWQLNGVASTVVRRAAAYNGETSAVDDAIQAVAGANGLRGDRLWVEIDTDAGAGRAHRANKAQAADAPPPAGYGSTVTVHLTYREPLLFNLFGGVVPLGTTLSQESVGAYGGLAP